MSDVAIRVEHLSKSYKIRHQQTAKRYATLREDLMKLPAALMGKLRNQDETFWALDDVSFEIHEGEVVGIIGRNGAGKSTLLKILARITEPTHGRAEIFGRVGSLLEVGTGFHPELTGRENIYLSGAILGMTRAEIRRKFDEIVDFAEVEKFLDTPAKHYSSGMYVRLAFAVAAHLEPEILLVDEVLAVGDAQFQKKCLGKMGEVAQGGRTVLFVSHNMAAVQKLCRQGILLGHGKIALAGDILLVIRDYMTKMSAGLVDLDLHSRVDRSGTQDLTFTNIEIIDIYNHPLQVILSGQKVIFRFHYVSKFEKQFKNINIAFNVFNQQGVLITNLNSKDIDKMNLLVSTHGYFQCCWPNFNLRSGTYTCNLFCEVNGIVVDWVQSAFIFVAEDGDFYNTGSVISRSASEILVNYDWQSFEK